jgi:hypothetical protein
MASIIAHRVFSELVTIAQSNAGALDRHARISQRMEQFKHDIVRSQHPHAAKGNIITKLRGDLEIAANSPALSPERRCLLAEALDTLTKLRTEETDASPEPG